MIKTISVTLIFLLSFSLKAKEKDSSTSRVITYNILYGFEKDSIRREKFIHFMKQADPDIVSLDELVGFKEKDLLDLAKTYGHSYVAIVKEKGYPMGITSKYPIEVITKNIDDYWHGMLHVRTMGIDCILTHLNPFDWKYRLKEAQQIVHYVEQLQLKDYLLMGDMNAYSPMDAEAMSYKDSLLKKEQLWDNNQETYRTLREGRFDYSVIATFLSAGMEDMVGRIVQPTSKRITYPCAFGRKLSWYDKRLHEIQCRLDYIFVSSSLAPKCVNAIVYNGTDLEGISDHYPVCIELDLGSKNQ